MGSRLRCPFGEADCYGGSVVRRFLVAGEAVDLFHNPAHQIRGARPGAVLYDPDHSFLTELTTLGIDRVRNSVAERDEHIPRFERNDALLVSAPRGQPEHRAGTIERLNDTRPIPNQ